MEITNEHCEKIKEFRQISSELEEYNGIFSTLCGISTPVFTEKYENQNIDTMCIVFDSSGDFVNFCINPKFWDMHDNYSRKFFMSHECLHILLNHGGRSCLIKDKYTDLEKNIAMDLVVNHMLVNSYGFDRSCIKNENTYVWTDTIFKDDTFISKSGSFEYYLENISSEKMSLTWKNIVKQHKHLQEQSFSFSQKIARRISQNHSSSELRNLCDKLSDDTDNQYSEGKIGEALIPGQIEEIIYNRPIKIKRKWNSLIKRNIISENDYDLDYQWINESRRMVCLSKQLIIPTEDYVKPIKDKIKVLVFMDASGSCYLYSSRMHDAYRSMDPSIFDVELCYRTTIVIPYDKKKKNQFRGTGSDDFRCMENYIQNNIKNGKYKKYPDAVFHITDGGDCSNVMMKIEYPERWHWFLLGAKIKNWIPKRCNIHNLEDFE